MKTFVKTFRGKMSYKRIDTYVNLVRSTSDEPLPNAKILFFYGADRNN